MSNSDPKAGIPARAAGAGHCEQSGYGRDSPVGENRGRALCRVSTVTHRTFARASRYAVTVRVGGVMPRDANGVILLRPLVGKVVSRWKGGDWSLGTTAVRDTVA